MSESSKRSREQRVRGFFGAVLIVGAASASACLDRPLALVPPETSNSSVTLVKQSRVEKIDLLLVVDNSQSMLDKQRTLEQAVPQLVGRLASPRCIDDNDVAVPAVAGKCPAGSDFEFEPLKDIHIGIVSSSLGSHGGNFYCNNPTMKPHDDDHAHLIGTVRPGVTSWNQTGFLVWDPGTPPTHTPAGEHDVAALENEVTDMITQTGEDGCGFESTLESWYRFLVDPSPPTSVTFGAAPPMSSPPSAPAGIDQVLLKQRAQFLRPDSLVSIIELSDENDCSISDVGYGYLLTQATPTSGSTTTPRATSACAQDPNSPCCRSCETSEMSPPPNCGALADDPACKVGKTLTVPEDNPNQRCFDQKRRFGVDLLYPVQRYIDGLTNSQVLDRDGKLVQNPLFAGAGSTLPRDKSLVLFAAIVGVPWQDLADDASLHGAGLRFLNADEMQAQGRWSMLLGVPSENTPPGDPLMIESPDPRTGIQPQTKSPLGSPDSHSPTDSINGHEYHVPLRAAAQGQPGDVKYVPASSGADLQYACTFPLPAPVDCSKSDKCDCSVANSPGGVTTINSPLCQPPTGGPAGTTQYYAKAYPGVRHLQVLQGIKAQGIAASICPKVTGGDPQDPSFGYNPAVNAIIERMKAFLGPPCLPRRLAPELDMSKPTYGEVPCRVVEARLPGNEGCNCNAPGRSSADDISDAVRKQLATQKECDGVTGTACSKFCLCEIAQLTGDARKACQFSQPSDGVGYCYVDGDAKDETGAPLSDPKLTAACPSNARRRLRFNGDNTPVNGSVTVMACEGAKVN